MAASVPRRSHTSASQPRCGGFGVPRLGRIAADQLRLTRARARKMRSANERSEHARPRSDRTRQVAAFRRIGILLTRVTRRRIARLARRNALLPKAAPWRIARERGETRSEHPDTVSRHEPLQHASHADAHLFADSNRTRPKVLRSSPSPRRPVWRKRPSPENIS